MKKSVIVVAILGILTLVASACAPGAPMPTAPTEEANFKFLISDEPNDIGDFEHLNVTISSIGVQQGGDNGTWLQFSPDIGTVDLKELQGKNAQEIWSGNVTPGQYTKVFIYVSGIEGILAEASGNSTATVKLPSGKLQISKPFVVSENATISFIFDITVIKAGKSGMYVLKPQIAESGADKEYSEVKARDRDREQEREERQLKLRIEGDAQPGAEVVLVVTDKGKPVEGATVTMNGQEVGLTDEKGKIGISLPEDAEEVEIKATLGEKSGELELEFEEEAEEAELEGTIETIDGHIWTVLSDGEPKAVDVENAEIEGNPEVGAKVEVKGTSRDGLIVASEVEIE